ncbi:MAG: VIT1/CCC1 transporter family protein [Candidatus Nomurabacteria bacterium]|nr:VIT1/CCC1 transporter family protein [Candidatus Nomurabacteria bacterium]
MKATIKKYLSSIVYGGSDGAVSYFTLMAGAYGAGLSIKMLIAIGVSNVVADAFSMATADYLSEDSKINITEKEEETSAVVTFISFILIGFFPLAPSLYAYYTLPPDATLPFSMFLASTILTLFSFTYIGYLRGKILKRNLSHTIIQSIIICSISAVIAYYLGEYIAGLVN